MAWTTPEGWLRPVACALFALGGLYLFRINRLLKSTPDEIRKLTGPRWVPEQLRAIYDKLDNEPIQYNDQLPLKLDRRYIVTGGNGLVGGFIVLQLIARGQSPGSIRILDVRETERNDMLSGPATEVDCIHADITKPASIRAAFEKPWNLSVAHLPLTVFHTAAVIIPSDRSKHLYGFPEAVNVRGTENVLKVAKEFGADIFSSTSSGSIPVRPMETWVAPWARSLKNYWQVLDEKDFFKPLRQHDQFFGNYPASKAVAERIVCAANTDGFQTGCIRPVNGVYGNPTDNTVGDSLSKSVIITWMPHIVQNFVHGANVAIAHLHHEAALTHSRAPQAGRPYVVTDPNPPIMYRDMYLAVKTLSINPPVEVILQPIIMLILAHILEFYSLLPYRLPLLRALLPELKGDVRYLKPGLFSICTHLVGANTEISKPLSEGGLGYKGVLTTLEGVTLEVLEWNREHTTTEGDLKRKIYTSSIAGAEKIQQLWTTSLNGSA